MIKLHSVYESKGQAGKDKNNKPFIKTIYSPKYEDDSKEKIFAPLRKKYLDAKPEEIVRQEFICRLINDYGYCLEQMDEEVRLTTSQRGTGRAYADLIIWKSEADKKKNKTAFMVVELKADYLPLKVEDCYQGYNYATWSRAKLFAISNGKILQVYKTIEEELPLKLQPVNDIPLAKDILDDKKLNLALAKTKEFTGDEFAKLLFKCHNIIRNNDKLDPADSFDEISKILFIKIMYERKPSQEAIFSFKQFEILKSEYTNNFKKEKENEIKWEEKQKAKLIKSGDFEEAEKLEKHIKELIKEEPPSYIQALFKEVKEEFVEDNIFEENEKIKLREKSFEQIVKELQIYNLTSTSADVKGIAFEKFLGRTFRGELGQFFTPRVIVDFIVDVLEPQEDELICDPCAGSGGFLIKTFESIRAKIDNKFIKDKKIKEEKIFAKSSKEYKEEIKNSIEVLDDEAKNNLQEEYDKKAQEEFNKYIEDKNIEQKEKIEKLSHKAIFGTDANPRMARVSKMNMIMHGDGHNGIHHNDGLLNVNGIFRNRFDVILTNPPFGATLDKKFPIVEEDDKYTNETMIQKYIKEYGDVYVEEMKQVTDNIDKPIRGLFEVGETTGASEVLFIERCLTLLRAGGRMGIVLPEGVLNSANLQKAREQFEGMAKIILIVSLPQDIFISSGATVKTSLVFFKKFTDDEATQYEKIKKDATQIIGDKHYVESLEILKPLEDNEELIKEQTESIKLLDKKEDKNKILKIKENITELKSKSRILKKEQTAKTKIFLEKITMETKALVKEKFDYEIPIADIQKAGITTTGAVGDNQLPELLKIFTKYRKDNKLWDIKK